MRIIKEIPFLSFFLSLLLQMQDGLGVDCYGEYYPEIDRRGL